MLPDVVTEILIILLRRCAPLESTGVVAVARILYVDCSQHSSAGG